MQAILTIILVHTEDNRGLVRRERMEVQPNRPTNLRTGGVNMNTEIKNLMQGEVEESELTRDLPSVGEYRRRRRDREGQHPLRNPSFGPRPRMGATRPRREPRRISPRPGPTRCSRRAENPGECDPLKRGSLARRGATPRVASGRRRPRRRAPVSRRLLRLRPGGAMLRRASFRHRTG